MKRRWRFALTEIWTAHNVRLAKDFIDVACILPSTYKENEPAPAATGTSSEISKDTNSTHLDDSTLLDICQEGIEEMAKIALDDYPNEFLTGYVEAFKHNIERLRGGDGK